MEPVESRSDFRSKKLSAHPSEVFAAMSDPVRIARWWGPAGFTSTIHELELFPGGRWLLTMHGPDGRTIRTRAGSPALKPARSSRSSTFPVITSC